MDRRGISFTILFFILFLIVLISDPSSASASGVKQFNINAGNFSFTPSILRVSPGDQVSITLISTDVTHGIAIPEYGIELIAEPGRSATNTFIADRSGVFRFQCAITCGDLHPFMVGKLIVGDRTTYRYGIAILISAVLATIIGLFTRSTMKRA